MSARNRKNQNRLDAFEGKTDLEQVADEIFGASAAPEFNTGRVVARPTHIDEIWADVRQPRRVIPASIRLVWGGSPSDVPRLLDNWASVAANAAGRTIDIGQIISGEGDGVDTDGTPAIYESFISLLRLAGSILRDGLINPITIVDGRDHHLIESGERRWLAYWLLHLHTPNPEEFSRIPAVTVSGADYVWRQAAENTARRNLNAVGMARQLALLVMAARGIDQYRDYADIVAPGQSDRRFYAQVADGNAHRIPKGAAERIQSAMGLSKDMLSHYRDILHLTDDEEVNDALWMHGDIEDWPESAFRDANRLTIVNLRQILSRANWSYADFRPAAAPPSPERVGVTPPPTPSALPPVGTHRISPPHPMAEDAVLPSPVRGGAGGGVSAEDPNTVLKDLHNAFERAYELEIDTRPAANAIAGRATVQLNLAQTSYDSGHFDAARRYINTAVRILTEPISTSPERIVENLNRAGFQVELAEPPPASDNPPSQPSAEKKMVKLGDTLHFILTRIQQLSHETHYSDAAAAALALLNMTRENAERLKEADQLGETLQMYFDSINVALNDWSQTIGGLLDDLINQD